MNLAVDLKLTRDEFLRWVQSQEGRFEFHRGKIVMMAGGSIAHARIYTALAAALLSRLPPGEWSVTTADVAIEIGEDIRYPDLIVERATASAANSLVARAPVLIGEVLSPSTLHLDFGAKAQEYMSLPSLQAYLVAAQDEARIWLWRRGPDGTFPREPQIAEGLGANAPIPPLALELPLTEIFRSLIRTG